MQYYIYSMVCFLLPGTVWLIWNKGMIADKAYKTRHIIWIYIYMFYGYLAVQEAAGIGTIWFEYRIFSSFTSYRIAPLEQTT